MAYPSLVQRIAARHVASMPRTACIVAAGTFGDSYCLLKNRDRNYLPEIRVVHEVKDGVEVAYLEDEFTGWVEGLNEFGIGIVNAALMVSRDETERDTVERTGKKLGDGERILKALAQETVAKAAKSIREYKGGLKGHTVISDGKKSYYVEMPDSNDLEYDDLPLDKLFVRTNHGVEFSDAGYVEGEREDSSKSRQEEAERVLSEVNSPDDIAPALLKAREERWESTEMVRDDRSAKNMRTTTQMVLDLTEKKLILYLLPDKVKWLGLDDRMPEGRKAKIEVQVLEYKDLSIKTNGDTKVVKKGSDGLLPILDPAFNVREMFKQLVLLEDHLFHPRKRCPDCIWKHLFTTEALAEEAVTLDVDQRFTSLLGGLADQIRRVQRAVQEGLPFEFIAQKVREVRKGLLSVASQVRVASGKQGAYFNVGDSRSCSYIESRACLNVPSVATTRVTDPPSNGGVVPNMLPLPDAEFEVQTYLRVLSASSTDAGNPTSPRVFVEVTTPRGGSMKAPRHDSKHPQVRDVSRRMVTGTSVSRVAARWSTGTSWSSISVGHCCPARTCITATDSARTTGSPISNFGPSHSHQDSVWRTRFAGLESFSEPTHISFPTSEALPGFRVGDLITYGKFQNKPGKLVRIFTDERGIPMIEIEPVPKGRKKNRVMGLFRVRHVTPPEEKVASRWLTRTAAVSPEEMALEFLTDLGIHAHIKRGVLLVDRTSMVEFSPRLEENRAYDAVLAGLKAEFPDYRIYWGGRTDEWMGVEFHPKAGRTAGERKADPEDESLWEDVLDEARDEWEGQWPSPPASQWAVARYNERGGLWRERTAEGKYKEKKKVPKADGSGTTTVYVYGPRQIANRNKEKAERVEKLRHSMKDLRKQVHDDLDADDDKTRLTALAIALIDATFERVGNDDSADEGHFGVTGWLKKHLTFGKGKATIKYVGKSGVKHEKVVDDAKLVKALKGCCEDKSPDDPILSFGSEDADGPVKITSRDVNAYLKPFDVTAKDLRGFHANREMQEQLRTLRKKGPELPKGRKEKDKILKEEFKKALEATADAVGHEASTLRTQYLVPGLEDAYMKDGTVIDNLKDASVERVASAWLRRVATKTQGEREEEEAARLVRQSPSKKPPRDDSKRERMKVQDDPDVDAKDKDLSLNYKDTGG